MKANIQKKSEKRVVYHIISLHQTTLTSIQWHTSTHSHYITAIASCFRILTSSEGCSDVSGLPAKLEDGKSLVISRRPDSTETRANLLPNPYGRTELFLSFNKLKEPHLLSLSRHVRKWLCWPYSAP